MYVSSNGKDNNKHCKYFKLLTVFVAVVTSRPAPTVHPVRPVALHLAGLKDQAGGAQEVGSLLRAAVPVLGAVEQVGVPEPCESVKSGETG